MILEHLQEAENLSASCKTERQEAWETCLDVYRDAPSSQRLTPEAQEWLGALSNESRIDFWVSVLHDIDTLGVEKKDMSNITNITDTSYHPYSGRGGGTTRCLRMAQERSARTFKEKDIKYTVEYISPGDQEMEAISDHTALIELLRDIISHHGFDIKRTSGMSKALHQLHSEGQTLITKKKWGFALVVRLNLPKSTGDSRPTYRTVVREKEAPLPKNLIEIMRGGLKYRIENKQEGWYVTVEGIITGIYTSRTDAYDLNYAYRVYLKKKCASDVRSALKG